MINQDICCYRKRRHLVRDRHTEELKEEMIHEGMKEYIFRRKNEDAMNKIKSDQERHSLRQREENGREFSIYRVHEEHEC